MIQGPCSQDENSVQLAHKWGLVHAKSFKGFYIPNRIPDNTKKFDRTCNNIAKHDEPHDYLDYKFATSKLKNI